MVEWTAARAQEDPMSSRFAVALFHSRGIAEDACNRLRTEGVPDADIALDVLRRAGPVPPTMSPELEALSIDPMVWGDVRNSFVRFVKNGETAVFVQADTEEAADFALEILRHYAPVAIDVFAAEEREAVADGMRSRAWRRPR
jgi:hypothetical protein